MEKGRGKIRTRTKTIHGSLELLPKETLMGLCDILLPKIFHPNPNCLVLEWIFSPFLSEV